MGRKVSICALLGWEIWGRRGAVSPPSIRRWPNQPSGYTGHEIRICIPGTTATSNFPSMKYSAAPQPQSALRLKGRGSCLLSACLPLFPCTHLPSIPRPGPLLSYLCAFTDALCPKRHPPQIRTILPPPPPSYPAPTHSSPRPTISMKSSLEVIFHSPGPQTHI